MPRLVPSAIAGALALTAVFTLFVFLYFLGEAKAEYARTNQLAVYERSFLFLHWREKQEVTVGMLSATALWVTVVLPAGIYMLLHPIVGKLVASALHALQKQLMAAITPGAKVSSWSSNALVLLGSAWPVTIAAIPFQVVAIMLANLYRSLWSEDGDA